MDEFSSRPLKEAAVFRLSFPFSSLYPSGLALGVSPEKKETPGGDLGISGRRLPLRESHSNIQHRAAADEGNHVVVCLGRKKAYDDVPE